MSEANIPVDQKDDMDNPFRESLIQRALIWLALGGGVIAGSLYTLKFIPVGSGIGIWEML